MEQDIGIEIAGACGRRTGACALLLALPACPSQAGGQRGGCAKDATVVFEELVDEYGPLFWGKRLTSASGCLLLLCTKGSPRPAGGHAHVISCPCTPLCGRAHHAS
eukprot:1149303-Pelagomonas_calceolata.AAC.1